MKTIALTRGKVALVDDADFDWLNQWKWCAQKNRQTNDYYAVRKVYARDNIKILSMHRVVLGLFDGDKKLSDHRNRNTLDNRRENLRVATEAQNSRNRKPQKNCSSQYKGVAWYRATKKWVCRICINGIVKHLGYYRDEVEAANRYDQAARTLFGEFAYLNFPKKRKSLCKQTPLVA